MPQHLRPSVVLTGGGTAGHIAAALAVWQELAEVYPKLSRAQLTYIGEADGPTSGFLESAGAEAAFMPIRTGKIRTYRSWRDLQDGALGSLALARAHRLLGRAKAHLVISGGGHTAVPIVLAARARRLPVIAHEQTLKLGLANRLIFRNATVRLANYAMVAEAAGSDVIVTGPLVLGRPVDKAHIEQRYPSTAPLLFVTGGSQGSKVINEAIWAALPQLLETFTVIHQAGAQGIDHGYTLAQQFPGHYYAEELVPQDILLGLLQFSALVIGRSGAGTVAGMQRYLRGRALLVPLAIARGSEQHRLAQMLVDTGQATIVEEPDLSQALTNATDVTRGPGITTSPDTHDPRWATDHRLASLMPLH